MADVDRPIEYAGGEDRYNLRRGRDGGLYGEALAMFGSAVTYRLDPTSPTVQQLLILNDMQKLAQEEGTEIPVIEGTDDDEVQGRTTQLMGGVLQNCPDQLEPGVDFEATIVYEKIIADVEGATFMPLLESASA